MCIRDSIKCIRFWLSSRLINQKQSRLARTIEISTYYNRLISHLNIQRAVYSSVVRSIRIYNTDLYSALSDGASVDTQPPFIVSRHDDLIIDELWLKGPRATRSRALKKKNKHELLVNKWSRMYKSKSVRPAFCCVYHMTWYREQLSL